MPTEVCVAPIEKGGTSTVSVRYPAAYQNAFDLMVGELESHFRAKVTDQSPLFCAGTSTGSITRKILVDGSVQIDITIPDTATANFPFTVPYGFVVFDIARTAGGVRRIAPGRWKWPVWLPVTRD